MLHENFHHLPEGDLEEMGTLRPAAGTLLHQHAGGGALHADGA